MFSNQKRITITAILLVFIMGAAPLVLDWFLFERHLTVSVQLAKESLNNADTDVLLVDVRSQHEFSINHILGSTNWPLDEIVSLSSIDDIPEKFKKVKLFLICDSGIKSAIAAQRLSKLSVPESYSVRGGIQAWYVHENSYTNILFDQPQIRDDPKQLSLKLASEVEDWGIAIAAYMTKFVYMTLSLLLVFALWNKKSSGFVALFWSMGFFFIGEAICFLNYVFFGDQSLLAEYLHSFGMVASIGFFAYSLFDGLDQRVFKYSDANSKCALLGLCKSCSKYREVSCVIDRLIPVMIIALIVVSIMPLTFSPFATYPEIGTISLFYNYGASILHHGYEIRYCSIMAIILFSIALLTYILKQQNYITIAKIFTAAGIGHMMFGIFRLTLRMIFIDSITWFTYWEETTELISIAFIGIVLWILRGKIFEPIKQARSSTN